MQVLLRRTVPAMLVVVALLAFVPTAVAIQAPDVVAENAIVIDATTGEVLFEKNATERRAMASLTKLFTALVALETVPLDTELVVEPVDLVGEASMGLSAGDVVSFRSLLHGLVLPSGNDAASTIARVAGRGSQDAFIHMANERIAELGLTDTHLVNPHGLDADGHHSTARDIAALAMYALQHQPALVDAIHTTSYSGDGFTLYNTNRLLNVYPGLIGGKTGLTDDAGYCLMQVAEIDGRKVLVVLLGSTWESWYADAERLLDHGFEVLAIPGRAVSSNVITFPSAREHIESPSLVGSETGLAVTRQPSGDSIVTAPAIVNQQGWSPWFWLGAVAVVSSSLVYIAFQLQKLLALIAYGSPRRRVSRSAPVGSEALVPAALLQETQSFPSVAVPVSIARESWVALHDVETRRRRLDESLRPVPSFAGD